MSIYDKKNGQEVLRITLPGCIRDQLDQKFLEVPVQFYCTQGSKNYIKNKNTRYYDYFKQARKDKIALSYRFLKEENGEWYVLCTFTLDVKEARGCNGHIGIDQNYGLIASVDTDIKGNWVCNQNYQYELENKTSEQILDSLSLIAKDIVLRAKREEKVIVLEDLDLEKKKLEKNSKSHNRKLNLLTSGIFRKLVISKCLKEEVEFKIDNPAYSSKIGLWKYQRQFKKDVHTLAAFVMARRGRYYKVKDKVYRNKEKLPNLLACVLHWGEARGWSDICRHRHHWSHWICFLKNLDKCIYKIVSYCRGRGRNVSVATVKSILLSGLIPDWLSFLQTGS